MKILLIEDELELAAALSSALAAKKALVDHVCGMQEADIAMKITNYDAIVLDRRLPEGDGVSLLREWRKKEVATPVLILSAVSDTDSRVEGLESGADDYLAKPFDFNELYARLKALVRRPSELQSDIAEFGNMTYDFNRNEVSVMGEFLLLTRRETLALKCLTRRFGQVVSRQALMEAVFSLDDEVQPNALDLQMSRLRVKLRNAGSLTEIMVVRGVGYFLRVM